MADIKPVILVVDDEISIRESFSLILGKEFRVITAASGEAALKRIIDEKVDLVYLDIRMPGMTGIETLKRIKEIDRGIEVIMVTAVNDVASAGTAIKLGAKDYVVKPFEVNDILSKTRSIVIKSQAKVIKPIQKEELIGSSKLISSIRKSVEELAHNNCSVLMLSERGLEGEIVANIISSESKKALKIIDAQEHMNDSVIFGYEKGSFTEAFEKRSGALEEANGGILFIRNIELLPNDTQQRIADSMAKNEMTRNGSMSSIHIDVRLIAETSVNIKDLVKSDIFCKELYDKISETVIELPPLRQRESDIPILINHYMEKFADIYNKKVQLTVEAANILSDYPWPGNLIELSNTLETLVLDSTHESITPDDLPIDILIKSTSGLGQHTTLDHIGSRLENAHIIKVFNSTGQNKSLTSALLGIQQKTLESRLESMNA